MVEKDPFIFACLRMAQGSAESHKDYVASAGKQTHGKLTL